ncbi:MAG: ATP-binding protein [Erysipelotrichaceae bacterium]
MKSIANSLAPIPSIDFQQSLQAKVDRYNEEIGTLQGNNCSICKNKGYVMILDGEYTALKKCECLETRRSKKLIEKSGLKQLIQEYTFEKFSANETWQRVIKDKALEFVQDIQPHWFFIGGQVGAGKTHICTAIVNELMQHGHEALYMLWRDEIMKLKANVMEGNEYTQVIHAFKTKKVLYIDDLFKSERGKLPTTSDINIAFEILNARYNNPELITILSSEKILKEILGIDEAIGSRIFQRAGSYILELNKNPKMNMRLRERKQQHE